MVSGDLGVNWPQDFLELLSYGGFVLQKRSGREDFLDIFAEPGLVEGEEERFKVFGHHSVRLQINLNLQVSRSDLVHREPELAFESELVRDTFDEHPLFLHLHPVDPVDQVDEVVSRVGAFGDLFYDLVDLPDFAALATHEAKFVHGDADEEHRERHWQGRLVRVARVVGHPEEGLHANNYLRHSRHVDRLHEVVLARVAQLVDRLQVWVYRIVVDNFITLPH